VARLELAAAAVEDLERLILTHSLPQDTKARVRRSIQPLEQFPLLGAALGGRWEGFRFVLGPWRWMVIVYAYLDEEQRVVVVTIQDGRAAASPAASR
jgi:plasmid stabilization system protein ParE